MASKLPVTVKAPPRDASRQAQLQARNITPRSLADHMAPSRRCNQHLSVCALHTTVLTIPNNMTLVYGRSDSPGAKMPEPWPFNTPRNSEGIAHEVAHLSRFLVVQSTFAVPSIRAKCPIGSKRQAGSPRLRKIRMRAMSPRMDPRRGGQRALGLTPAVRA